jgi:hypothetical protein
MRLIDIEPVLKAAELVGKELVSIDLLKDFEQVDAVPVVRGKWVLVGTNEHHYETSVEEKCSLCGRYVYRYDTELQDNYCPNCGAKMDGDV